MNTHRVRVTDSDTHRNPIKIQNWKPLIYKQKTYMVKQKTSTMGQNKSPKIPLSWFCVGHLPLGVGPVHQWVCISSGALLEKTSFSFGSDSYLETGSGLGGGAFLKTFCNKNLILCQVETSNESLCSFYSVSVVTNWKLFLHIKSHPTFLHPHYIKHILGTIIIFVTIMIRVSKG